jgi:hypothetical protein
MLVKPIFLSGLRKSGTSMIRNLLDGHPDLYVHPMNELHFFTFTDYMNRMNVNHRLAAWKPPFSSPQDAIKKVIECNWVCNYEPGSTLRPRVPDSVDQQKLKAILQNATVTSYAELYELIVRSVARCDANFGKELGERRSVVKGVQQEEHLPELVEMLPDVKFVYVLRNPYAQFNAAINTQRLGQLSVEKQKEIKYDFAGMDKQAAYPFLGDRLRQMSYSYYFMLRWSKLYPRNFTVVCYDEILQRPEETLKQLAAFLEIEFTETMLETTQSGKAIERPGWSAQKGEHGSSRIQTESIAAWKTQLRPGAAKLVTDYFQDILQMFGFETFSTTHKPKRGIHPLEDKDVRRANAALFLPHISRLV